MALVSVTGKTVLPAQALPAVPDSALTAQDRELIAKLNALSGSDRLSEFLRDLTSWCIAAASVSPRYLALDFASALRDIMLLLGDCNAYFDANKPWQLRYPCVSPLPCSRRRSSHCLATQDERPGPPRRGAWCVH